MEYILQNISDTQKLLADGPVTTTKAVLNYSDNKTGLKIKTEISGTKTEVSNALTSLFQVTLLGDKTTGEFKFVSRQTKLNKHLDEKDVDGDGFAKPDESDDETED